MIRRQTSERFWSKVEKSPACWQWVGAKTTEGYGQFSEGKAMRLAHRYAYRLVRGSIPVGLTLDHLCRNRACVNPDHLEPVTHRVNILRGTGFSAVNAAKTHCPQGHPYGSRNTYIGPAGQRQCRECHRAHQRAYLERRRHAQ